jgi:electron transfer flavoprotein alpha subunit
MILVIAEQRDSKLNRASWEAIAAAQQLAADAPVTVAIAGSDVTDAAAELATAAVVEVVTLTSPHLALYTADGWVQAHAAAVAAISPRWIVLPHTYQTRDFAPALAGRLDRALVTDCTAIKGDSSGPIFSRPMFQGKLAADVRPLGDAPWLVTMQIGAFRADRAAKGTAAAPVRAVDPAIDPGAIRQKPEPPFQEARQAVDLSQAQRIVAVGRGIKGPEHLPSPRAWPAHSVPSSRPHVPSATRAGCRWNDRSAARVRPSRRSCTWRSVFPAQFNTSSG